MFGDTQGLIRVRTGTPAHRRITLSKIIEVRAEINIPRVPNFLITTAGMSMPLSAFTEDGLRQVAAEWTQNLLERAAEQRMQDKEDTAR